MIKGLFKTLAFALVLGGFGILLNPTFAGLTDPSGFILDDGETCALVGGCMCDTTPIADGVSCSYSAPGSSILNDGIRSAIVGFNICIDVDGCTFTPGIGSPINLSQSETCQSDNNPTLMLSNGQCNDRDGCLCSSSTAANGGSCSDFIDITAPVLVAGSVSNTTSQTPSFTFTSTEAGTITYIGSCSSSNTNAILGNNTITFSTLANATYSNCQLKVTDAASNGSARLNIPSFTVNYTAPSGGGGGGGGGGSSADYCPNGDLSTSRYDGKCTDTITTTGMTTGTSTIQLTGITIEELKTMFKEDLTGAINYVNLSTGISKYRTYTIYPDLDFILKTPIFTNLQIRSAVNRLNIRITSVVRSKVDKLQSSKLEVKVKGYQDIFDTIESYNKFLGVLYGIVELNQKDLLTPGGEYFKVFLINFAKIK